MKPIVFINLPVADLAASMKFYNTIGFINNPQFTDDTAACMVYSEEIMVMLLTHEKFQSFTTKAISNSHTHAQVMNALAFETKDKVDELTDLAHYAGATEARPKSDYGFMYGTAINDLDGHIWEFFWMDPTYIEKSEGEFENQ
ncbi:VOC family protein [Anditalea andensis]|uniref:VOC domain-containing protein n=1 Tax=Anditalea andensis TaxID=1048983 RepID=A0A074KVK3_9BACT|nr:VOC family protein [Anditalea andensis]KEO72280.1 hypothetical protein EL17_16140 [Anditalea andensis]